MKRILKDPLVHDIFSMVVFLMFGCFGLAYMIHGSGLMESFAGAIIATNGYLAAAWVAVTHR